MSKWDLTGRVGHGQTEESCVPHKNGLPGLHIIKESREKASQFKKKKFQYKQILKSTTHAI